MMSTTTTTPICKCRIGRLKLQPFNTRKLDDKLAVVKAGRPQPKMKCLLKSRRQGVVRHFKPTLYATHIWLAGCETLNRLFCWPCLLFSYEKCGPWSTCGYDDLNNLHIAVLRHGKAESHINASIKLKKFEKNIIVHEELVHKAPNVKEKRKVLKRLITATCFLANQESPGPNVDTDGNSIELVQLLARYDVAIKAYVERRDKLFTGMPSEVHNDIVECTSSVILSHFKDEINDAQFFGILLNMVSVSKCPQLSTIVRYITKSGDSEEYFLGFTEVGEGLSAGVVVDHVIKTLDSIICRDKLVSVTCDDAMLISGELEMTEALVRQTSPCALFVHGVTNALQLVLTQVVNQMEECNIFFGTLKGLSSFFLCSAKRRRLLDKFVQRRVHRSTPICWRFNDSLIRTILTYRVYLLETFDHMKNEADCWTEEVISAVQGYTAFLNHFTNCFLLNTFACIFDLTRYLFQLLQMKIMDIALCEKEVKETKDQLAQMRNDFVVHYEKAQKMTDFEEQSLRKGGCPLGPGVKFRELYDEILDIVCQQIDVRFGNIGRLAFFELLDSAKFVQHAINFPTDALSNLSENYGRHFDAVALKAELGVIYRRDEFGGIKSVLEIFEYLKENDLTKIVPQIAKLCSLILTFPSAMPQVKRLSSKSKRVKRYARSQTKEKVLSAVAIISIENKTLKSYFDEASRSKFIKAVIAEFDKKNTF